MFALGIVSRSFDVAAQGLATLRTSWPNASHDGYFMCYIVRDDKVHSQMLSNGILRIKSPTNMYPAAGAVWSTMKWYKYALKHTVAKLIGHAEDGCFVECRSAHTDWNVWCSDADRPSKSRDWRTGDFSLGSRATHIALLLVTL